MKLKLITAVAALVASAFASAGELDGKGYICEAGYGSQKHVWSPWFRDGHVFVSAINPPARGEEPVLQVATVGWEYSAVGELVSFDRYFLNRKTLRIGQENRSPHSASYGDISWSHQCEEAASLDSFRATMEREFARKKIANTCRKEPTEKLAILCFAEATGETAKEG